MIFIFQKRDKWSDFLHNHSLQDTCWNVKGGLCAADELNWGLSSIGKSNTVTSYGKKEAWLKVDDAS